MNCNELMIGNWVKLMNPIGEWLTNVQIDSNLFIPFLQYGEDGFAKFEPIPLTAEILEKNGWTPYGDCEYVSPFDVDFKTGLKIFGFGEYYDKKGFGVNIGCVQLRSDLKYVHELQNLMRSLGKIDLADNFKI